MTPYRSPNLNHHSLKHGFFTRLGGQSTGLYRSLNCGIGSDDNPVHVSANRHAVLQHLAPSGGTLCGLSQIHSNKVHLLEAPWNTNHSPKGDGMVTRQKNIILGILTADCAPVLFADPEAGVIGAAHAGWQGALSGIIENILNLMQEQGARLPAIKAAVGPCIGQDNYEVGPEFRQEFLSHDIKYQRYFMPSSQDGHHLFDLKSFTQDRLLAAGLSDIILMPQDTYAIKDEFFSYRRTTHAGELDYGRQMSCIMLT